MKFELVILKVWLHIRFWYYQMSLNQIIWECRRSKTFCTIRKYVLDDYEFVSMKNLIKFKEYMKLYNISINDIPLINMNYKSDDEIVILFKRNT